MIYAHRTRRKAACVVAGALMATSALVATVGTPALAQAAGSTTTTTVPVTTTAAPTTPADPHWGPYRWDGGKVKADDRAFWLFDRTDDPMLHSIIEAVAGSWNAARAQNMALEPNKAFETPFVRVHRDDKNAGQCFVNQTAGYAAASACKLPFDFKVISAQSKPGNDGHLTGGAFALGEEVTTFEDAFTAVCRGFGVMMGLEAKANNATSCMTTSSVPKGTLLWYSPADVQDIKDLYSKHNDKPVAATTTTVKSGQ